MIMKMYLMPDFEICKFANACLNESFFPLKHIKAENSTSRNEYWCIGNFHVYGTECDPIDGEIYVFGMIRGWDEGWDDKCVGLIVHPDHRGKGYGSLMLHYLEIVARNRGIKRLRLHVSPKNHIARKMYEKAFWYPYGRRDDGEIIMFKRLISGWERERTRTKADMEKT